MGTNTDLGQIPLPKGWPEHVKSAVLHVVAIAGYAMTYTRGWAANSRNQRVRLQAKLERAEELITRLQEEIRIKDSRMSKLPAHKRPHYPPVMRMAILEYKAARNWSVAQTARAFIVDEDTIRCWLNRAKEEGEKGLIRIGEPVNKFPEFVSHIVCRLKVLCPTLGRRAIARVLACAGLHLAAITVGRMLKTPPDGFGSKMPTWGNAGGSERIVTAKYPNHVWHLDLTAVPTHSGFSAPWIPFSLPQCWPFCYWVLVIVDHYSRRIQGLAAYRRVPTSVEVQDALDCLINTVGTPPKHIICDQGKQFCCESFENWCLQTSVRPRYGAIGQYGSIAVVERLIRTLKDEWTRRIEISMCRDDFQKQLNLFQSWYNMHRPHAWLKGRIPDEVYHEIDLPRNAQPRYEPRLLYPVNSPCASPQVSVRGSPGVNLNLRVTFLDEGGLLPIVGLREAS